MDEEDRNAVRLLRSPLRKSWHVDLLLWSSLVTLGIGLFAPILTFRKLLFFKSTVSIYSVLTGLIREKEYILFLIIVVFSVLFPLAKNGFIALTHYSRSPSSGKREAFLRYLGQVSKWSMLDVFLVALLVVIARLGVFGSVQVRWGIYVFAASVILSTLAVSHLIQIQKAR
ncbi:MAG: paraquat-inducible protein A [Candidatus Aminicenantes bacterium]|nr:paraquat-inducible protein A [Candidatus Aminicenantes bacterium]